MTYLRLAALLSAALWLLGAGAAAPSVYDLDASWRDQDAKAVTLGSLRGQRVFLAMFYAGCQTSCPLTVNLLQRIERQLPPGAPVRFVLVSLDGANDTPARLRAFAALHRLTPGRWTLLSGAADDVRDLAAALGIRYKPGERGEIAHSTGLFLLDGSGAVRETLQDLAADPAAIVAAAGRP
jgi:protein SCO1/2